MKPSKTKICKYCGEDILTDAIKCKHCHNYQEIKYTWRNTRVKPSFFQKTFCTYCQYEGKPKTITDGSLFLEIILWCCFLIPGLIYSGYRQKSKYCVCKKCGSDRLNKI